MDIQGLANRSNGFSSQKSGCAPISALLHVFVVDVFAGNFRFLFAFLAVSVDVSRRLVIAELLRRSAHLEQEGTDFIQDVCGDTEDEKNFDHGAALFTLLTENQR
jgi:hypothetical protein